MSPAGSTTRLGRYHLAEPIGGGPTGEVFRAKVHGVAGFEREFAVKKFHVQLIADGASLGKLRASARLYAGLEHPRIARLIEHNLEPPQPFAAVEWVTGIDLSRLVSATFGHGRPLPAGAATALISRAARSVGYSHGRGQNHLGLCPTNLICTAAGEVKVTDFGFLSARLGERPSEDSTLTRRLPYLAPEQLTNASTSAATDVFCLGTIFYELLSGRPAFAGKTGREIAASVLAATPQIDEIPKPLARVLGRCFAQSPFERYPGGGALADAIDAAARGMLMRGDQRDVARAVQEAQERLDAMRKDQVSGMFSFPLPRPPAAGAAGPSPPMSQQHSLGVPNLELDERVQDEVTTDVRPVGTPVSGSHPMPMSATRASQSPMAPSALSLPPPVAPRARSGGPSSAPLPPVAVGSTAPSHSPGAPSPSRFGPPPSNRLGPPPEAPMSAPTASPAFASQTGAASHALGTDDFSFVDDLPTDNNHATVPFERSDATVPLGPKSAINFAPPISSRALDTVGGTPGPEPPPMRPPSQIGDGLLASRSRLGRPALIALGMASLGALGFFSYLLIFGGSKPSAPGGSEAGSHVAVKGAADASVAPTPAAADAAPSTGIDGGAATTRSADAAPSDIDAAPQGDPNALELVVTSRPKRALVYLDGTNIGKTPVKVDIGGDQHKVVLIHAGYKLHVGSIKGGGTVHIELEPVTPSGGPAGIKVRCRNKNRYYALIDGKETGQLCPTERIEVELGAHTVEVYDPVTDSRRRWDVEVVQTSRSHRVRVDF